jgi:hypothetical protein
VKFPCDKEINFLGEMAQALYAHMDNKTIRKKKEINFLLGVWYTSVIPAGSRDWEDGGFSQPG